MMKKQVTTKIYTYFHFVVLILFFFQCGDPLPTATLSGTVSIKILPQRFTDSPISVKSPGGKLKIYEGSPRGRFVREAIINSNGDYSTDFSVGSGAYVGFLLLKTDYISIFEDTTYGFRFLTFKYDQSGGAKKVIWVRGVEDPVYFIFDGSDSLEKKSINVFYHLNVVRNYFVSPPISYNGLNFMLEAIVDKNNEVKNKFGNAAAQKDENRIFYYSKINSKYTFDSEVSYHEFTHIVMKTIFSGNFIENNNLNKSEGAAMDEGFSDYYAAVLDGDPKHGEGRFSPTRNLVNNLQYPSDMVQNGQKDGQVIAGVMWDLRSNIGIDADLLLFGALQRMSQTARPYLFEDFKDALLVEDDIRFGDADGNPINAPHLLQIQAAFQGRHGFATFTFP